VATPIGSFIKLGTDVQGASDFQDIPGLDDQRHARAYLMSKGGASSKAGAQFEKPRESFSQTADQAGISNLGLNRKTRLYTKAESNYKKPYSFLSAEAQISDLIGSQDTMRKTKKTITGLETY